MVIGKGSPQFSSGRTVGDTPWTKRFVEFGFSIDGPHVHITSLLATAGAANGTRLDRASSQRVGVIPEERKFGSHRGLTNELSGGVAVRLECLVRRDHCGAATWLPLRTLYGDVHILQDLTRFSTFFSAGLRNFLNGCGKLIVIIMKRVAIKSADFSYAKITSSIVI